MAIDRSDVLRVLGGRNRPSLTLSSILHRFHGKRAESKALRKELRGVLRALVESGEIDLLEDGYRIRRRDGLLEGRYLPPSGSDVQNAGSVIDERGERWKVESAIRLEGGERVLFRPLAAAKKRGDVVQLADAERDEWIGIFETERGHSSVTPYRDVARWRFQVAARDRGGARAGEVVVLELLQPGSRPRRRASEPRGRILERLGRPGDAEADFRAIAWRYRLPIEFSREVEREAAALESGIDRVQRKRRVDLRQRCFVTIDPVEARDHDDALCAESVAGSDAIRLFVAIADVAHYVDPGSAIDREALRRGNSVYFPDRSIPMLPARLSSELCSLVPDEERLVLNVEMLVDGEGKVVRRSFYPAWIRSRARLSYEEAARRMEPTRGEQREIEAGLQRLHRVTRRLGERRFADGSIDFELRESRVRVDEAGRPVSIAAAARTRAHRAVEEAMLAANRSVSGLLSERGFAVIHRVHEPPDASRLDTLRDLFERYDLLRRRSGRGAARDEPTLTSGQIHRALRRAEGHPEERLVNMLALRSMKQARYVEEDLGHFALSFESYLHFTSPIRRYADLVVHRVLKRWMDGADDETDSSDDLQRTALRASFRERIATDAEREMVDVKKCVFMQDRIGEVFEATISGVTRHGLFVNLDAIDIDGLVPIASLGTDLELDERQHSLVARRSRQRYRLGASLEVRLEEVNVIRGWIRFELAEAPGPTRGQGRKKSPAGRGKKLKSGHRRGPQVRRRGAPSRGRGRR